MGRLDDALPEGWRRHARTAHLALLDEWVGAPLGRWLKTDLYEERAHQRSLLDELGSATWIGADLSPEVAAMAHRRQVGPVVAADVRSLPVPDGTFDGVLSTSTLDHFDDPADIDRSLVELRRVLRPGGALVLTLDNPRNPLIRLRNALPHEVARRTGLVPFSVGCTLDERGGRAALRAAGFEVERTAHLLHAPHVVGTRLARFGAFERHALPRLDGLARTRLAPWSGHFAAFLARAA